MSATRAVVAPAEGTLTFVDSYTTTVMVTPAELAVADPTSLEIGRWKDRGWGSVIHPGRAVAGIDALCGPHEGNKPFLVGTVPSFDDRRVGDMMMRCGVTPRWHYYLIDVGTLVAGYLAATSSERPMHNSDALSMAVGVDPGDFDRHTAEGDVAWVIAQYVAVHDLVPIGFDALMQW